MSESVLLAININTPVTMRAMKELPKESHRSEFHRNPNPRKKDPNLSRRKSSRSKQNRKDYTFVETISSPG